MGWEVWVEAGVVGTAVRIFILPRSCRNLPRSAANCRDSGKIAVGIFCGAIWDVM